MGLLVWADRLCKRQQLSSPFCGGVEFTPFRLGCAVSGWQAWIWGMGLQCNTTSVPWVVQRHDPRETVNKANGTQAKYGTLCEVSCYKRDRLSNNGTLHPCRICVEAQNHEEVLVHISLTTTGQYLYLYSYLKVSSGYCSCVCALNATHQLGDF